MPKLLVTKILTSLHCYQTATHLGFEKTLAKVRSRFYWYGYQKDTEIICKKCEHCVAGKSPPYTIRATLQQDMPSYPLERNNNNGIIGPLSQIDRDNIFILVITDYFTKWPEACALPNHRAESIAIKLVDNVI